MNGLIKKIIFAGAAILIFLVILEGASRLYNYFQKDSLQSIGREVLAFNVEDLSPYVLFRKLPSLEMRGDGDFFYEFDDEKVTGQKAPGEYRIFIMGGSVAKGYGASVPEKKFHRLLENLLNENRPPQVKRTYNVVSAGRLGYVSAQELVLLLMGTLDFHPDMVIHLNGFNDIIAVTQYQETPGYPFYFQSMVRAIKSVKIGRVLDSALEQSALLSNVSQMMKKYKPGPGNYSSMNITRHYARNMGQIAQMLRSSGIEAYFFLQPTIYDKKIKSPEEQNFIDQRRIQNRQVLLNTYPLLADSLNRISEEHQVHWSDFRGVFDGVPEKVFNDSAHFNDRGQEVLAKAMYEEIKDTAYANSVP